MVALLPLYLHKAWRLHQDAAENCEFYIFHPIKHMLHIIPLEMHVSSTFRPTLCNLFVKITLISWKQRTAYSLISLPSKDRKVSMFRF